MRPRASSAGTEAVALEVAAPACERAAVVEIANVASLFAPLGGLAHEVAALAYFDAARRLRGLRHLAGATDWLRLPIRQVARDALAFEAHGIVLAHNHPSGDARASAADLAFTRRLALCLDALDVRLHDHLIVARDRVTSLRAEGFL